MVGCNKNLQDNNSCSQGKSDIRLLQENVTGYAVWNGRMP